MAIHSSILAWRIPWTEEPGRLHAIGSQKVRHDQAHTLNAQYGTGKIRGMKLRGQLYASKLFCIGAFPYYIHSANLKYC